jgi:alkanesulfonate monooxygenase SsuD/methylene tetrahydromethanopterin reductase-like flavin-dependent oxidoreductase (luciferase family)
MTILAATCWPQVPPEKLRTVARAAEESGLAESGVAGDAHAVADAVRFWAAAGADKVVLHPGPDDQDPVAFVRFAAEQVQPLLA